MAEMNEDGHFQDPGRRVPCRVSASWHQETGQVDLRLEWTGVRGSRCHVVTCSPAELLTWYSAVPKGSTWTEPSGAPEPQDLISQFQNLEIEHLLERAKDWGVDTWARIRSLGWWP